MCENVCEFEISKSLSHYQLHQYYMKCKESTYLQRSSSDDIPNLGALRIQNKHVYVGFLFFEIQLYVQNPILDQMGNMDPL